MKLNELSPSAGSTSNRKRVGRGVGSGTGKTAGRGVKGQKARSGKPNATKFAWLNLRKLGEAIEAGQVDASNVTEESLVSSGVIRRAKDGIRLLAKGDAPKNVTITVTGASKAAVEAIEKAGGKVTVTGVKEDAAA